MAASELLSLLRERDSLLIGVVDDDGVPFASRAWGVTASPSGPSMIRVVIDASDPETFPGFAPGAHIAVTGGDPITLQSAQLKGRIVSVDPAGPDDIQSSTVHRRETFAAIKTADGTERRLLDRLVPQTLAVCTVEVDACFDQTPGPGAGASVEAS